MWFAIWSVLIVATVVAAFFLGRDLWRKVKAMMRQVSAAGGVFADAAEQIAACTAEVEAASGQASGPTMWADRADLLARVLALRDQRAQRRAAAREGHRPTWERWAHFNE